MNHVIYYLIFPMYLAGIYAHISLSPVEHNSTELAPIIVPLPTIKLSLNKTLQPATRIASRLINTPYIW